MAVNNNGRPVVGLDDWMRNIEKRLMREERRPSIRSASDLVGPGVGPYARPITDWNFDQQVNGWFYSDAFESVNSPDDTVPWMGWVEASPYGEGMQQVWQYKDYDTPPPVSYIRTFTTNDDGTRDFTTWVQTDSGGGGGGTPVGPAGGDLTGNYPAPLIADDVVAYTWNQPVAASTWNITHPLRFRPNVTVIDSSGREVEGDINYSTSTIVLTFSGAFAGVAYLS